MFPGIYILLVLLVSSHSRARPNIFNPVSNATCQPEYAWMNNAEAQSPCLTVAYVIAACVGDTWTQPALPPGYTYDSPNGTAATAPCYCSWSCYNLMMGCTLCQNPTYTNTITTWPSFSQDCPSNYKEDIFPQGYVLAGNASIPYWATINPTTWLNELFNVDQAQNYTDGNHSDYRPSISSPSSNKINLAAVIGGTIGGVAGLMLILAGACFLYKHRRTRRAHDGATQAMPMANAHAGFPLGPAASFPLPAWPTNMQLFPSSYAPYPHGNIPMV